QERPLRILLGDRVVGCNRLRAGRDQCAPNLRRQRLLVVGNALRLGKGVQSLDGVFTELAVDLAGREAGAVEQNLRLYDRGMNLVPGQQLARPIGAVDRCRIEPGMSRADEADEQSQSCEPALQRKSPNSR